MASSKNLVYSTNPALNRTISEQRKHAASPRDSDSNPHDGVVRIHRETKGRGGKGVSLVKGLVLNDEQLKELAKKLKQHCGTGGTVKDGVIEIQGDQREKIKSVLENLGYAVKLAGG